MSVELQVERERPEPLGALRRWLSEEDAVQRAWYVTGQADSVLVVTAASMEGFDAFMERRRLRTGTCASSRPGSRSR